MTVRETMFLGFIGSLLFAIAVTIFIMHLRPNQKKTFFIPNVGKVSCLYSYSNDCGLTLTGCDNSVKYRCMTNVQEIGE